MNRREVLVFSGIMALAPNLVALAQAAKESQHVRVRLTWQSWPGDVRPLEWARGEIGPLMVAELSACLQRHLDMWPDLRVTSMMLVGDA